MLTRLERFALLIAPRLASRYLTREIRVAELERQARTIANQRYQLRCLQAALAKAKRPTALKEASSHAD